MSMSSIATCLSRQMEHGQIQIIFGPMFSGKTTELMRRMKRYQIANYRCLIIKYAKDTRYDENGIATHDRQVLPAIGTEILSDLTSQALHYDIIGIDEGQFFPDIASFSDKMAEHGKIVIVAALDGTFQKKGFGTILDLVPLAESIVKLSAVCMNCFKEGSFTKRISSQEGVIEIGGADKYMSVCRQCFKSPKKISRSPLKALNGESTIPGHHRGKVGTPGKTASPTKKRELTSTMDGVENAVKQLF